MEEERLPTVQRIGILPPLPEWMPKPPKIVSPEVIQTILQDEIAGRLADLCELTAALGMLITKMEAQMEKAPVGAMRPFTKTITGDTVELWKVIEDVGYKCTSATIYNDGPDSVYTCLNELRNGFQEIKEGEKLDFDFHGHALIERFFLKSTSSGTANLRIPLEY